MFHGEISCERRACRNNAYWNQDDENLCGVHARKESRVALPKRPRAEQNQIKQDAATTHMETVRRATDDNQKAGRVGQVHLTRMRMMRAVDHIAGCQTIFPNFKHGGRSDGIGMPALSPMSLGQSIGGIDTRQPGLPRAAASKTFIKPAKCFRAKSTETGIHCLPFSNFNEPCTSTPSHTATSRQRRERMSLYFHCGSTWTGRNIA